MNIFKVPEVLRGKLKKNQTKKLNFLQFFELYISGSAYPRKDNI